MDYVVYYSIGSIFFLLITIIFYFNKKFLPNQLTTMYKTMLIMALLSVIFDTLSVVIDMSEIAPVPKIIGYLVNMIFILSMHTCLTLFVVYLFSYNNIKLNSFCKLLLSIPYSIVFIFTLLSPVGNLGQYLIFYINDDHIYQTGMLHPILYIASGIYLLLGSLIIMIKRKMLRKSIIVSLLITIILLGSMVVIQIITKRYLLTASATAIGMTVMYYVLQLPSRYLDKESSSYNRAALLPMLKEKVQNKKEFMMVLISIKLLNNANNNQEVDKFIENIGKKLNSIYRYDAVCHMYYTDYLVLCDTELFTNKDLKSNITGLERYFKKIESKIFLGFEDKINDYQLNFATISCLLLKNETEMINFVDYIIYENLINNEFVNVMKKTDVIKYQVNRDLALNFKTIFKENDLTIKYKEIKDINRKVIGITIVPSLQIKGYEELDYAYLLKMCKKDDLTSLFIQKILESINNNVEMFTKYKYINLYLPNEIFSSYGGNEILIKYFSNFNNTICFVFDEKDYSKLDDLSLENLKELIKAGFKVTIDNFGVGYTNSNTLLSLDLFAVKVNLDKLDEILDKEKVKDFLQLVFEITKEINTHFMCGGIKTESDLDLLKNASVNYYESHTLKEI